ncbi:VCBS repeat-containing protein (plasmid) [Streptomyces longwoodensis]|uniref:VCBS repeat-containing protein n=1 Tax=Streptomyces longwoodensis TaxID=68231 RepID=UPI002F91B905|nr:VCBS repeat-containing protein [Streptomyces longwoodensis]
MSGLRFLPWVRDGLAGGLPSGAARAAVEVGLTVSRGTDLLPVAPVTVTLLGPGDVTGVDPGQIIRAFPAPDATGVETTGFAAVEFDRPDLPWMFSPGGPDERGRLRPWLVLVVVPEADAQLTAADGTGTAPAVLSCPADALPDLASSWAWAHAQLVATPDEDPLTVLEQAPERSLSRIVCPTVTDDRTRYLAALVPAYEAGRLAGLGLPQPDATGLAPAWQPGAAGRITLPVYHSWRFSTGLDGDFESLARQLKGRPITGVGARAMDLANAGVLPLASGTPEATAWLGSALRTPGTGPLWPEATRTAWRAAMRARFTPGADRLPPPLYGGVYGGAPDGVPPAEGAEPAWLAAVNLEPQHRAAAALGARVVQDHQEDLVAAVQEQAADLREANALLSFARLARSTGSALHRRRFAPPAAGAATAATVATTTTAASTGAEPGVADAGASSEPVSAAAAADASRALSDAQLLAVTRPVHDLVPLPPSTALAASGTEDETRTEASGRAAAPLARAAATVADLVDGNPAVAAATTPAFRRATRGGAAGGDRLGASAAATVAALAGGLASPVPPARLPAGAVPDTLLRDAQGHPITLEQLTAAFLSSADPWWLTPPPPPPAGWLELPQKAVTAPVVTSDGRLFLLAAADLGFGRPSGSLYEQVPDPLGGPGLWRNHGSPEGFGRSGLQGNLAVTPGTDGPRIFALQPSGWGQQLVEHRWVTDRWIWRTHPLPNGEDLNTYTEPVVAGGAVWAISGRQTLCRLDLAAGTWSDYGKPSDGILTVLSGQLAVSPDGTHVFALAGPGTMAEWRPTAGAGTWTVLSAPGLHGAGVAAGPADVRTVSTNGELYDYRYGRSPAWRNLGKPLGRALAALSPSTGDVQHAIATDGTLLRGTGVAGTAPAWRAWTLPAGHTPKPAVAPVADPYDANAAFVLTAEGRVLRAVFSGSSVNCTDRGTATDPGGQGGWLDWPTPDRRRYAPGVGLFASVLVSQLDVSAAAPTSPVVRHATGRDLGFDGAPRAGWVPGPGVDAQFTAYTKGVGTAVADLTGNGRPDLVVLSVDYAGGYGRIGYRVGFDLDKDGAPTGGWGLMQYVPELVGTVADVDIALSDLDGDGRPELIVAYAKAEGAGGRVSWRIGWRLDATGRATGGWGLTQTLPATTGQLAALGVDVVDVTDDDTPDLVLVTAERGAQQDVVSHRIGRSVNRRGLVTGGWSDPVPYGGPADAGAARLSGLSVAAVDLTGTRRADLLFLRSYASGGVHRPVLSAAFDLDPAGVPALWGDTAVTAPDPQCAAVAGASLAVTDLDPVLTERRAAMGGRFVEAAMRHQSVVSAAQRLTRQTTPPTVPVAPTAAALRAALDPLATVPERTLSRIGVDGLPLAGTLPPGADPLRSLVTGVEFPEPVYELLRALSPEHLLGGAENVPADTVGLLETDPAFLEAFLLGLNTELGRELLWREVPVDPSTTYFRQFWDTRGSAPDGGRPPGSPLPDIPPVGEWGSGALGSHTTGVGAAGEGVLVLVVRGELLRRYPDAAVTARKASWTSPARVARTVQEGGTELLPLFSARFDPDLRLFCFPLTRGRAVGEGGDAGWFFCFREQPSGLRFGLDEGEQPPADPYNSAHYASRVLQRPVFVALHADDLLPAGSATAAPGGPGTTTAGTETTGSAGVRPATDAKATEEHGTEQPAAEAPTAKEHATEEHTTEENATGPAATDPSEADQ